MLYIYSQSSLGQHLKQELKGLMKANLYDVR